MEVELSSDKSSFMLWVRVPKASPFVSPVLGFLNSVGGPGVVSHKEEREILKEMIACSYEVGHEAYKNLLK